MKKFYEITALAAGMLCLLSGTSAFAGTDNDTELVKQQVQKLITQNQQLTQRIIELESVKRTSNEAGAGNNAKTSEALRKAQRNVVEEYLAEQLEQKGSQAINEFVTLSGLIEGEFSAGDDFEGNNVNEFVLATSSLGSVLKLMSGQGVLFLHCMKEEKRMIILL